MKPPYTITRTKPLPVRCEYEEIRNLSGKLVHRAFFSRRAGAFYYLAAARRRDFPCVGMEIAPARYVARLAYVRRRNSRRWTCRATVEEIHV